MVCDSLGKAPDFQCGEAGSLPAKIGASFGPSLLHWELHGVDCITLTIFEIGSCSPSPKGTRKAHALSGGERPDKIVDLTGKRSRASIQALKIACRHLRSSG